MKSTSKKAKQKNTSIDPDSGRASHFQDNRPDTLKLNAVQNMLPDSETVVKQRKVFREAYGSSETLQKKESNTGLPDNLKAGIENLSGYSMDNVNVHYNSDKPGQINAHAYTQNNDIYVAPGQKKYLSHEAWHVVQQKEGRVKPTTKAGSVSINDDASLEKEADVMGSKALQKTDPGTIHSSSIKDGRASVPGTVQRMHEDAAKFISVNKLMGVKATLKSVKTYVKNIANNNQALRYGLRDAWNTGLEKEHANFINYSDELLEQGHQTHQAKVERETKNKLAGDEILAQAMDQYQSQQMSGPVSIEGFRICRHKRGIAVAVSRSTGRGETKAMKNSMKIERVEHADTYKWFSESQAHTEKFVNTSSSDTGLSLVIWLDLVGYLQMRREMNHEYGSSGLAENRFHQENVSDHPHLINIGIHPSLDGAFQHIVINVKDLQTVGKLKEQKLLFVKDKPKVSELSEESNLTNINHSIQLYPQELLYAHAARFRDIGAWRKSDAFKWFEDMILTFGPSINPMHRDALLLRFRTEFNRPE